MSGRMKHMAKRMASGGKTEAEMKSVGRNRAKLANQFGSDKPIKKAKGGKVHTRGSGAATRGDTHDPE